jgi:membrane-bound serine protease (ClpP class)
MWCQMRRSTVIRHRVRGHRTPVRRLPWLALLGLALLALVAGVTTARAASDDPAVHVVEVSGPIDLGLAPYLDRVLDDAAEADAAAVLLEVNTPGGRLDAVLRMQDALVGSPLRTIAFVDRMALSAGALVTIASDEIYVAPGSTLGAATPVVGGSGEPADEKTFSAVRATFAATAGATGRDPRVAEAMVDPDVAIEGLVGAGELLTLGPDEAVGTGYAKEVVADRAGVLDAAGLAVADVVETAPSPAESVVRFLTNPVVASLLVTLAMWLLIADLTTGGIGLASGIAVAAFAVFVWGHLLAGLAGWEEVVLLCVGLVLIGVELLVVPGVGLPGLVGLAAVLGGLFMAQLGGPIVTGAQVQRAAVSVGATFAAVVIGLVVAVRLLSRYGAPHALVLDTQLGSGELLTERATGGWVRWFGGGEELVLDGAGGTATDDWHGRPAYLGGRRGVAVSNLRPSGIAEIDGERVDVVSSGGYIPAGDRIEVVRDDGYRRVVERLPDDAARSE